jgi:hypothetical protein
MMVGVFQVILFSPLAELAGSSRSAPRSRTGARSDEPLFPQMVIQTAFVTLRNTTKEALSPGRGL